MRIPNLVTEDEAAMGPTDETIVARNARRTLVLVACCVAYVLCLAYVPGFAGLSPLRCQVRAALGLHCAGCGMTRAMACIARLDPATAVRFHPLVLLVAPATAVFAADTCSRAVRGRRLLPVMPAWLVRTMWLVGGGGFAFVLAVRVVTWARPDLNPEGWLLPPASFPP